MVFSEHGGQVCWVWGHAPPGAPGLASAVEDGAGGRRGGCSRDPNFGKDWERAAGVC